MLTSATVENVKAMWVRVISYKSITRSHELTSEQKSKSATFIVKLLMRESGYLLTLKWPTIEFEDMQRVKSYFNPIQDASCRGCSRIGVCNKICNLHCSAPYVKEVDISSGGL